MSFWNTLKQHAGAQFLDVIEWTDDSDDTVVYRFPVFNQAITDNSKLVVREGQAAVFVSEGKLSDVFGPGTYTLDTQNAPIMGFFKSIAYGLNYPYKGDIYFVNTKQWLDQKWGTANPIPLRDAEFGMVRLRAFGTFSFRVSDPATFLREIVGTDGLFTTSEITKQLKRKAVSVFTDSVAKSRIPALDLAASYMDLGDAIRERMNPTFVESYGVSLTDFTIENISMPPEVEKALDTRTRMGVLGNLDAYTKLQAADAIQTAAANKGIAGAGMGMGVGFGMGNMMGNAMAGSQMQQGNFNPHQGLQQSAPPPAPPPPSAIVYHYNGPSGQQQGSAADIAALIAGNRDAAHHIWAPGFPGWKNYTEVPEIVGALPPAPPPLPSAVPDISLHYNGPGGSGEMKLADIVEAIKAHPDADHYVWKAGMANWSKATDLPEVQQAMAAGGPPPLPGGGPPPPPA